MKLYYGSETKKARDNFPFSMHRVHKELIYAIATIKKAAALANADAGDIDTWVAQAIAAAADEVIAGKLDDQFILPALQGGAGTSINMNVNEVLATRASKIAQKKVHPLDHVNRSQSTNDVNPSALKIACIALAHDVLKSTAELAAACEEKSHEFADVAKLGRTHLQDAVPTTLGAEFASFAATIHTDRRRIQDAMPYLYELNLGGTAIGNSINASKTYRAAVYQHLKKLTKLPVTAAKNLMSATSSQTDFTNLSASITALMVDLSKIANDIRLMASGPQGGFGEIRLPVLQKGSSIMPGKVNPIIPEAVNQAYFLISGKNVTIHHVAQGSQLELGVMFPILADYLISSLKLTSEVTDVFRQKCINGIAANKDRCQQLLEQSSAYATLLTPVLGYDAVDHVVQESLSTDKTIRQIILEKQLVTESEFDQLIYGKQS